MNTASAGFAGSAMDVCEATPVVVCFGEIESALSNVSIDLDYLEMRINPCLRTGANIKGDNASKPTASPESQLVERLVCTRDRILAIDARLRELSGRVTL